MIFSPLGAMAFLKCSLLVFFESGEIDEVWYDLYTAAEFEVLERFILKILRYRGDAIRVVERISNHWPVAGIATDEGDVCTV
jgi:hypothetical protein